jgi:PAP2 superfamily
MSERAKVSIPVANRDRLRALWRGTERIGLHEAVVVAAAFLVYFFIRGAVVDRAGEALGRGLDLIQLERDLGIYWELEMQSWILDSKPAIKILNWIYFWGHMPVIIAAAVYLYVRHRPAYFLVRNAFLASGAIGVLLYWAYPVAPPRLIPFAGFIDTMAAFDRFGYQAQETQAFVNPYAAVPSLHFGWAMLLGGVVAWVGRSRKSLVALGVVWPVAVFFAIIMTGNHFILDAVAGAVVSLAGLGIAYAVHRAHRQIKTRGSRRRAPPPEAS